MHCVNGFLAGHSAHIYTGNGNVAYNFARNGAVDKEEIPTYGAQNKDYKQNDE
jgi:hypothetical protein